MAGGTHTGYEHDTRVSTGESKNITDRAHWISHLCCYNNYQHFDVACITLEILSVDEPEAVECVRKRPASVTRGNR